MIKFINKHKIVHEFKFGFRKGHITSMSHPVLHFLDKIYDSFNKDTSDNCIAVSLDLKKAFDTTNHGILEKNNPFGFRGQS